MSSTISGIVIKETAKVGPRPEKYIEIYEFERYFTLFAVMPGLNTSLFSSFLKAKLDNWLFVLPLYLYISLLAFYLLHYRIH